MGIISTAQRLGHRHRVFDTTVSFNTNGRRKGPVLGRRLATAEVVDVSVSGAQLIARRDPTITVGSLITIAHANAIGTVRVARIAPVNDPAMFTVGVTFVTLDRELERHLLGDLVEQRAERASVTWQR